MEINIILENDEKSHQWRYLTRGLIRKHLSQRTVKIITKEKIPSYPTVEKKTEIFPCFCIAEKRSEGGHSYMILVVLVTNSQTSMPSEGSLPRVCRLKACLTDWLTDWLPSLLTAFLKSVSDWWLTEPVRLTETDRPESRDPALPRKPPDERSWGGRWGPRGGTVGGYSIFACISV